MINAAADECDIVLFLLPVADFVVKQVLTTYALFVSDVIAVMLRTWGQNFGLGLGLDKLASVSSIWPRPGLSLVNFVLKNVLSSAK